MLLLLCVSAAQPAAADDDSAVVARAGDTVITASDVTRRLQALPPAQLATFGASGEEVRQSFLTRVLVPELQASLQAKQQRLADSPRALDRTREILRVALDGALKQETLQQSPVTQTEVSAYFEANKTRFEQPLRVRLWRILVNDAATAERLLEQAKATPTPAKWSELAREHSVDKATHLRQGDLGFVHPNGDTDAPRVRVDAALFRAAESLPDGALVPKPVPEGQRFAVVWRRGSLAAKSRTLAQEEGPIRLLLERRRLDESRKALLARLRAEHVRGEQPNLLEQLPDELFAAKQRAATTALPPPPPARAAEPPKPSERGLR
ncbi:MAG TPA: peptidylprolyl isomerase [Polyangiaceae bacterium]|nr:peptidylprolyl isomerase [Polyangiaceae bacterium]